MRVPVLSGGCRRWRSPRTSAGRPVCPPVRPGWILDADLPCRRGAAGGPGKRHAGPRESLCGAAARPAGWAPVDAPPGPRPALWPGGQAFGEPQSAGSRTRLPRSSGHASSRRGPGAARSSNRSCAPRWQGSDREIRRTAVAATINKVVKTPDEIEAYVSASSSSPGSGAVPVRGVCLMLRSSSAAAARMAPA